MSLRVALIVFNQPERGTYFRAYHIGRELARRGHSCTLLYTAPSARRRFDLRQEEQGRLALVAAPDMLSGSLRSGWDPWAALARTLWLRGSSYDLVHAFECRPTVLAPALATTPGRTPLVIDWCDWFGRGGSVEERPPGLARAILRPVETFFEERFRTRADATTVINETLRQKAEKLGVLPESIRLIPNGCAAPDERHIPSKAAARAAIGLPAGAPIVGYAGAIFPRDASLMAAAFDRVCAARPDARLLVLGYTNVPIEQLVARPEAVLRTGPLSAADLRRGLRACDLGWVPLSDTGANRGRWPLKISTYMELGLPMVTSAIGDLEAFFSHYPAGVTAFPTAEAFANATLALLADEPLRDELGATGRRLATGELSWARVSDEVERMYQRLQ